MHRNRTPIRNIVIVDPNPDDYAPLLASHVLPDAVFHFATTAEDALRVCLDTFGPVEKRAAVTASPFALRPSPFVAQPSALALRPSPLASTLWLINLHLPDMCGLELADALRHQQRGKVLLVSDRFDSKQELSIRVRTSVPVVCKPPIIEWLSHTRPAHV